MKYVNTFDQDQAQDTAVTIGNFDGLHLGHQKLIHRAKELAKKKGLASVVLSFSPHPAAVLGNKPFYAILSRPEKLLLLEEMGVDIFGEYPFDKDFARTEPAHFIQLLLHRLRCKALVVGEGYRFGKDRAGTAALMEEMGERQGIAVEIVSHEKGILDSSAEEKISSSEIRRLIAAGDMPKAGALLSRPYFILGEVRRGRRLGRTIGFPTVNLAPPSLKLLPPDGVYAAKVFFQNRLWPGVTNIGNNPTVDGREKMVETHLFDFDRELYGETIRVLLYEKLRDEKKFDSVSSLQEQIARDTCEARRRLAVLS